MVSFETADAANEFIRRHVDNPTADFTERISGELELRGYSHELGDGRFTNIYDLSFPAGTMSPNIVLHDQLTSVFDYVQAHPDICGAMNGGYFYLADSSCALPRQLSLNLALADSKMQGFPIVDREALFIDKEGGLSAEHTRALGSLCMNGVELSWSGSLTDHETDAKVFGTGNVIINHERNPETGTKRILDPSSRYTPPIEDDDTVDIGFIHRVDGTFEGVRRDAKGGMDIFKHDVVVRTHERHAHDTLPVMRVRSLGNRALDGTLQGALSVGPLLDTADFSTHPLNEDRSLGSVSPLENRSLPRALIYVTDDGRVHLRLFDGRPGSDTFTGVTPEQAVRITETEYDITWGCFLDSGQTSKLVTRQGEETTSYGNRHYQRWPTHPGERHTWVPDTGRPTSSMVTLCQPS